MSFLERLRRREHGELPAPDDQMYPGYSPRFTAECQTLWTELVPDSGACTTVQGELLRAVQALATEAQDNDNVNWDRDFERFCDLLDEYLLHGAPLPQAEREATERDLDVIRRFGRVAYAMKPDWARDEDYPDPAVPEPEADDLADAAGAAYSHADLYCHLADCVAMVAAAYPHPVRYAAPADQRR